MRQKTQKCSKFHRSASLHHHMFELIIHAKNESMSFPNKFCSYFIGCGFANRAKS